MYPHNDAENITSESLFIKEKFKFQKVQLKQLISEVQLSFTAFAKKISYMASACSCNCFQSYKWLEHI